MENKIIAVVLACSLMVTLPFVFGKEKIEINEIKGMSSFSGENVTIIRDNYGVPHVFADTKAALSYGVGYAVAQDRLWQADLNRRQATGRLAEFGLAPIEYDYFMRQIGYTQEEHRELYNKLPIPLKEMVIAYVAGINLYIEEALANPDNKMPVEYLNRGLLPEPWTIEDTIAIVQMEVKAWGSGGGNELYSIYYLVSLIRTNGLINGWNIFNDRFPLTDPGADTTLNWMSNGECTNISSFPPYYPDCLVDYAEKFVSMEELKQPVCESLGLLHRFGSNGWVVSPWKSETGNSLLLGGPQMGHSIPQIVLEIGMHGAGIDAVGITFAGSGPSIALGANRWGAWTVTSGASDTIDTYIEVLHPRNPKKYLFNGLWYNMAVRTEIIYDASGLPHEFECYRTIHGPVMYIDGAPIAISLKMTFWEREIDFAEGMMKFQECKNVTDFQEAVRKIPASLNILWADRYGNIGYSHCGLFPIRPETGLFGRRLNDDRFPLWGTGKEEWLGFLPSEDLPQGTNPSEGFYANFNNKPRPDWPYAEIEVSWGEGYGVRRIQELLNADSAISFQDMIDICWDISYCNTNWSESHEIYGVLFNPFLLEAIDAVGGISPDVIAALKEWDGHFIDADDDGFYDSSGGTIFKRWYDTIDNAIFDDELGDIEASRALLLHLFQSENSKLKLRYETYLDGIPRDERIVATLQDVLSALEEEFDTDDISKWLMPVTTQTYDEIGALPTCEMPYMDRGTYNQVIELLKWDENNSEKPPIAVNVLPPGQCGFISSSDEIGLHAYDQLDFYMNWHFKPLLFNHDDILAVMESIITLQWIT